MYNFYSWYKDVTVKNVKTGKKRETSISKQIIRRQNLEVGDHINSEEIIIKIFEKEVKKVSRPYFEAKVVKVKKCEHKKVDFSGNFIKCTKCTKCGHIMTMNDGEPKLKGNWVNGENLNKIKFPCFCSYSKHECYGLLSSFNIGDGTVYELHDITIQSEQLSRIASSKSLEGLIDGWSIHILKGKIIIFEEE